MQENNSIERSNKMKYHLHLPHSNPLYFWRVTQQFGNLHQNFNFMTKKKRFVFVPFSDNFSSFFTYNRHVWLANMNVEKMKPLNKWTFRFDWLKQ